MTFTEIKPFVTQQERALFLSRIDEQDWYQHRSTVSGQQSPLQFKRITYRGVDAALMKMDPNTIQNWHTDGVTLKRSTLILHPLTEKYAPYTTKTSQSVCPVIANTQAEHAVFNNNQIRLNLQIPFDVEYNEAMQDNSIVWNMLNRFYEENDVNQPRTNNTQEHSHE